MATNPSHNRLGLWLLGMLGLGGAVLRLSPFFRRDGTLGWPVDYDEGVYTTAAALLWRGVLPYRDYFFAHPPGIAMLLAPLVGWLNPDVMLIAGRWFMALCGVASLVLIAQVVQRAHRWPAAILAASLYVAWPEAVVAERSVLLEPVLNLLGVCVAFTWLADRPRVVCTGVLLGLMITVKVWGLFWLFGVLVSARSRREASLVFAATVVTAALFIAPFAVAAPKTVIEDTVFFHLLRPPDGDASTWVRLREMFVTHAPRGFLALLGTFISIRWVGHRSERLALMVVGLLVAAFLGAAAFWSSYDAHLALPLSLAAGFGFGRVTASLQQSTQWRVLGALSVLGIAPGVNHVVSMRATRDLAQQQRAERVKALGVPACVFEPADALLAGALPAGQMVDSYGFMLMAAQRDGQRYESATAAFANAESQVAAKGALESCDVIVIGPRGDWQFSASRAWLDERFVLLGDGVFQKR